MPSFLSEQEEPQGPRPGPQSSRHITASSLAASAWILFSTHSADFRTDSFPFLRNGQEGTASQILKKLNTFLNTASRPVNNSAHHSDPQRARGEAEAEATLHNEAQGSWGSPLSVPALVPGHRKPLSQRCCGGCCCPYPWAKPCSMAWRESLGRTLPSLAQPTVPPAPVFGFKQKKWGVSTTTESVDPPSCRGGG